MKELMYNIGLVFRIAFRNIISAGLRTWLNIGVLSFAFIIILFFNALMDGWERQAVNDGIEWEYGSGQIHHPEYDPLDPFTIQSSHGIYPNDNNIVPVLIRQGNIYPNGRMIPLAIKGIDINQKLLELPTQILQDSKAELPVIIGNYMANANNLKVGDSFLIRWKDKHGTFDARNITVEGIFKTNVPSIDIGQLWMPIDKLWEMTGMEGEATYLVVNDKYTPESNKEWIYKSQETLLKDIENLINQKKGSSFFMYGILLMIALIAIFDSQVFSVFKRQKEIGTYVALGFTKRRVTALFTLEGTMYAFLSTIVGGILGAPLFFYLENYGMPIPDAKMSYEMGISVAERIYPEVSLELFTTTFVMILLLSAIVSYLPVKKIATMNTVDALKGKKL